MKKIAVLLSGCGYLDGSEITESISTLIALSEYKIKYDCFSLNKSFTTSNHLTQAPSAERHLLEESARISRGEILPLTEVDVNSYDGLIIPGGFGVAKNLCNWATSGSKADIDPIVKRVIHNFHESSRPIGAICIAPALIALALPNQDVTLTIGKDEATAKEIEKTGNIHEECIVTDYITDRANKVLSTPAYMYDASPYEVFTGIKKMISEFIEMA